MISHLSPDDVERFRQIRLEALTSDPDAFGETAGEFEQRTDAELAEKLSEGIESDRKSVACIDENGAPVAMCGFGITDLDSSQGFLWGLFVSSARRRRGLAKLLLQEAESWLLARGVAEIQAAVAAPNMNALALYRSCEYCVGPQIGTLRPTSSSPLYRISKRISPTQTG